MPILSLERVQNLMMHPSIFQKIFPSSNRSIQIFSNYGNIPIGLFTGAPNISIPLVNFEAGNNESSNFY